MGYIFGWTTAAVIGIRRNETMEIILSNITIIAMVASAFVGSLAYTVIMAISKYGKQKADAEILRSKIAESGRDPDAADQLTAAEKWELNKAKKFDRIFLVTDMVTVILGTALACAILLATDGPDDWMCYAVLGLVSGIISTWFLYELIMKDVAAGQWHKKSAEAFRIVKSVADKAAEMSGGYTALVQRYIDYGFGRKDAEKMARDAVVNNPDLMKREE